MENNIIERSDRFQYLVLTQTQAIEVFSNEIFELYAIHDDDSEALIESSKDFSDAKEKGLKFGIPIGFKYPKIEVSEIILGDLIKDSCKYGGIYQCVERERYFIVCKHISGNTFDYEMDRDGYFRFSTECHVKFDLIYRERQINK